MTKLTLGGLVILLLVAICLGWYSSVLSHRLDASQKEIMDLNIAIASREKAIDELKRITAAERHATDEQLQHEQQLREKANAENKTLRKALESSNCSNHRLPDSVISILRQKAKITPTTADDLRVPTSNTTATVR